MAIKARKFKQNIMDLKIEIAAVVVGVIGLLLKPIAALVRPVIRKLIDDRLRRYQVSVYNNKVDIAALLKSIELLPSVIYAVQIQTKNGGGLPKAGTPIYGSIVSPASHSEDFRCQLLDSQYCDMVSNLISRQQLSFLTADLPDCILKDLMLSRNSIGALAFDAVITKYDYNFIKIDLNCHPNDLPVVERNIIRQTISDITKRLRK